MARQVGLAGRRLDRTETCLPARRARTPDGADRSLDGGSRRRARGRRAPARRRAAKPATADISYEDFQKLDLRAAKVTAAERVPKADKLLKLTLDVGGDLRTVVSGIAPAYAPEQMVGKTVVYLANLAPRRSAACCRRG